MRIMIILSFAMIFAMPSTAQKKIEVPANIKAAFSKEYSSATNVKWEKERGKFEVSFISDHRKTAVTYNSNGSVDEVEKAIPLDVMPVAAQQYILKKGAPKEMTLIIKSDGVRQFEAEINGIDFIFDTEGKLIKQVKE